MTTDAIDMTTDAIDVQPQNRVPARIDEEDIRLTTGFADIFAAVLLVVGAAVLPALINIPLAVALTIPLVRNRNFAACAIVLSLILFFSLSGGLGRVFGFDRSSSALMLTAAMGLGAYWYFFRIPIAAALAICAVVGTLLWIGHQPIGFFAPFRGTSSAILAGTVLFGCALAIDASDRLRQTRRSDIVFWLHIAAAPLLVHGLFMLVAGSTIFGGFLNVAGNSNPGAKELTVWPILTLFAAIAMIALLIDRRPLVVSAFTYLIGATAVIVRRTADFGIAESAALAVVLAGIAILFLAALWTPARRGLLRLVPPQIGRLLPPAGGSIAPSPPAADTPPAEREPLRLVLGFNDYFVSVGAFSVVIAAAVLGYMFADSAVDSNLSWRTRQDHFLTSWQIWAMPVFPAVLICVIAEYFVRIRRMALPALLLACLFAITSFGAVFLANVQWAAPLLGGTTRATSQFLTGSAIPNFIVLSFAAAGANLLFWWRHRIPASIAWAIAMLLPLFFIDYFMARESGGVAREFPAWRMLVVGGAVFGLAYALDRRDPARTSQIADTAFWLHLLAALLWVPGLFNILPSAWLAIPVFFGVILLALHCDRRVSLLVALPFAAAAFAEGYNRESEWVISLLLLSGILLALALQWDRARQMLHMRTATA